MITFQIPQNDAVDMAFDGPGTVGHGRPVADGVDGRWKLRANEAIAGSASFIDDADPGVAAVAFEPGHMIAKSSTWSAMRLLRPRSLRRSVVSSAARAPAHRDRRSLLPSASPRNLVHASAWNALWDIVATDQRLEPEYPLPWADSPADTHLATPASLRTQRSSGHDSPYTIGKISPSRPPPSCIWCSKPVQRHSRRASSACMPSYRTSQHALETSPKPFTTVDCEQSK